MTRCRPRVDSVAISAGRCMFGMVRRSTTTVTEERCMWVQAARLSQPGALVAPSNESHASANSTAVSAGLSRKAAGSAATRATVGRDPSTISCPARGVSMVMVRLDGASRDATDERQHVYAVQA